MPETLVPDSQTPTSNDAPNSDQDAVKAMLEQLKRDDPNSDAGASAGTTTAQPEVGHFNPPYIGTAEPGKLPFFGGNVKPDIRMAVPDLAEQVDKTLKADQSALDELLGMANQKTPDQPTESMLDHGEPKPSLIDHIPNPASAEQSVLENGIKPPVMPEVSPTLPRVERWLGAAPLPGEHHQTPLRNLISSSYFLGRYPAPESSSPPDSGGQSQTTKTTSPDAISTEDALKTVQQRLADQVDDAGGRP